MVLGVIISAGEIMVLGMIASVPLMIVAIVDFVRQQRRISSKAAQEEVKRR
jgi:hypothetical protein